jgi:hypothetical protein
MARCSPAKSEQGEGKNNRQNEALTLVVMRVNNPDRSPARINRWDAAPAPTRFLEIVGDDFPVLHAHEHIIVRSWQSLMVSAQSLSPATVPTNPIGFPTWYFSSVCLGHVALFIKHADDRLVRARERAVLRVRDGKADGIGSCIPDWAESQPIADQIKAVPVLAGTDLVNVLGGGGGHFHPAVWVPQKLVWWGLGQPKVILFARYGFHIAHIPILWTSTKETFPLLFRMRLRTSCYRRFMLTFAKSARAKIIAESIWFPLPKCRVVRHNFRRAAF